jgi:hypothetical protein
MQKAHIERFATETECTTYAAQLQAPANTVIHWHCSLE